MARERGWISQVGLIVMLVLLAVSLGGFWARSPLLYAARIVVDLSREAGERIDRSSPAVADFNGDGYKEIVVGGNYGTLSVVSYNGSSWSEVWHRQTAADLVGAPAGCGDGKSDIQSAPVIADLDGDGSLEIVVSNGGMPTNKRNGAVLVYRYNGDAPWSFSRAAGWPQPKTDGGNLDGSDADGCWDGFWASPAVGDLDGDGDLEISVGSFDRRIHAWHHDGTEVDGWPIYRQIDEGVDCIIRGGNWSSPAMGDIDGDGLLEVVIGTESPPWSCPRNWEQIDLRYATVWAINGDSSNVPGWPVTTQNNVQSSVALGDIDGDGDLEVVVASGDSQEGGNGKLVYAWHHDGTAVGNWPRPTEQDVRASPALGDLDNDGSLDVVVGCGTEGGANCDKVYAWKGDGSYVAGFPATIDGALGFPWAPILADYDGNGNVDILLLSKWTGWGATVVKNNGQVDGGVAFDANSQMLMGSPVVDDVNGDDELDVIIAGPKASGAGSAVYIWTSVGGTTSNALPWPMFHRTVDRQGAYPIPPTLVFPDDVRVFHAYGSGSVETANVMVRNGGSGSFDWAVTHAITRLQTLPASGTLTKMTPVQFAITTTDLITGWHTLGTVTVTGTAEGKAVVGSPATSTLLLYVGNPSRVYLPAIYRNY